MGKKHEVIPPLPVSCLADYISSGGRSPQSKLRPYKFRGRGEGKVRSSYYPPSFAIIRRYYKSGRDTKVFDFAITELQKRAEAAEKQGLRTKLESNIKALEAFRRLYRNRNFKVLPSHRITLKLGRLVITAPPDLWVEENGTQILMKIGISKKSASYVDMILTIMRKAAIKHGHRIRSRNIVYLNVFTGQEVISKGPLNRFNRTLAAAAQEIVRVWPNVTPPTTQT